MAAPNRKSPARFARTSTRMNLDQWYSLGHRDGLNDHYDPPHGGLLKETFGGFSERELNERRAYKHGYHAGKKERSRRR